ncbi:MAG: hypothetical protein WA060_01215 [Minisyncoccia bacterium]
MFQNTVDFVKGGQDGLTYDTVAIGDLVNKDTDGDGILDWEEPLWGLDPTTKETTPGAPDSSVIKKLKAEQGFDTNITTEDSPDYTENLTETEKFSRELFSTVATLNQQGNVDEKTVDSITTSLSEKMQNILPRKVFTQADIKILDENQYATIRTYNDELNSAYAKNPIKGSVIEVLGKFVIDENNVDTSVLKDLDPIIKQTRSLIDEILKIGVPKSLVPLHLSFINGMERIAENIEDIKMYDTDAIVSLIGISQYEKNSVSLEETIKNLSEEVYNKLND